MPTKLDQKSVEDFMLSWLAMHDIDTSETVIFRSVAEYGNNGNGPHPDTGWDVVQPGDETAAFFEPVVLSEKLADRLDNALASVSCKTFRITKHTVYPRLRLLRSDK